MLSTLVIHFTLLLWEGGVRVFLSRKEEETQAPNHKVIRLHDGAIKQSLGTFYTVMIMYSQDKIEKNMYRLNIYNKR